jgi:hypothetical protein
MGMRWARPPVAVSPRAATSGLPCPSTVAILKNPECNTIIPYFRRLSRGRVLWWCIQVGGKLPAPDVRLRCSHDPRWRGPSCLCHSRASGNPALRRLRVGHSPRVDPRFRGGDGIARIPAKNSHRNRYGTCLVIVWIWNLMELDRQHNG